MSSTPAGTSPSEPLGDISLFPPVMARGGHWHCWRAWPGWVMAPLGQRGHTDPRQCPEDSQGLLCLVLPSCSSLTLTPLPALQVTSYFGAKLKISLSHQLRGPSVDLSWFPGHQGQLRALQVKYGYSHSRGSKGDLKDQGGRRVGVAHHHLPPCGS